MTENPLISWRLNRIDKMLEAASDEPGAECTVAQADQIRAMLRVARPAFEVEPGVNTEGMEAIRNFGIGSRSLSVASRVHIADLAIRYVTVQMMRFARGEPLRGRRVNVAS